MISCKKCNHQFTGKYCPECGTAVAPVRINRDYIISEMVNVLYFNKGIFFTIRELILRPGVNIRTFLKEDRNRLVKPILFLILCSLVYSIAQQLLGFEDGYVKGDMGDSAVTTIFSWIQNHYGYANIIMGIFFAFWTRLLFRKSGFNIYEVLILIFFTIGISMLIYTVFGIAETLTGLSILHFGGLVGTIYTIYAIGNFFNKGKVSSYLKALLSFFLGFLTSTMLILLVGISIDMLIK